ncbi:hypothetical protein PM082_023044 [Marasmius tenuissimus]|nr:hypothetical protein PM082_001901 [Marasmius tenuissimus]KAJ8095637.1 hypothetical protein PM082_023044 [Marasmius tenuissimus]
MWSGQTSTSVRTGGQQTGVVYELNIRTLSNLRESESRILLSGGWGPRSGSSFQAGILLRKTKDRRDQSFARPSQTCCGYDQNNQPCFAVQWVGEHDITKISASMRLNKTKLEMMQRIQE